MSRPLTIVLAASALSLAACARDLPTEQGLVRLDVRAAHTQGAGRPITVGLSQEVFTNAMGPYQGDPDGYGTATLSINVGQGELCYELVVGNIALPATAAHIHRAPAGQQGSIVIGLVAPTDGRSAACRTADRELLRAILADPSEFYVNVHNAQYGPGAIRSQLDHTP